MLKTKINENQFSIEEEKNNAVYRFTETVNDKLYSVKLNEIEIIENGVSKFI